MEEQGLANSMVDSGTGMVSADEMKLILDEVVRLLSEGVSPEELVEMGVPPEIIKQAMAVLETPQAQPVSAPADGGLATSMLRE